MYITKETKEKKAQNALLKIVLQGGSSCVELTVFNYENISLSVYL